MECSSQWDISQRQEISQDEVMNCDPPLIDKGVQEGTDNCSDMPSQDEQMSCDQPLGYRGGGQEGTDSLTDMPSQDKQMSCDAPLVDKGGQERTNTWP